MSGYENRKIAARTLATAAVLVALGTTAVRAGEFLPDNILFQGSLKQAGVPVTGDCDFIFALYEGESTFLADQIFGTGMGLSGPLPVANGLFQASLDFGEFFTPGSGPFSVEVSVRCPAGAAGPMETLSPRTLIEPVPLAYHAMTVESPDGNSLDASDGSPGNAVYVDAEGFVGIGTATPSADLHINKNASNVRLQMKAGGSWTAVLEQTNASVLSLSNGGSKRLVLEPGGDIGIGTESPSARLDVVDGTDPQLELRSADPSGDDAGIIIQGARNASTNVDVAYLDLRDFDSDEGAGGTEFSMAKIGAGMADVSGGTGWLRFSTNNGGGLIERMRIVDSGGVGIGTSSPASGLHLSRTGDAVMTIEADTDNFNEFDNARLYLSQDGGGTTARVGFEDGSNALEIKTEQDNPLRFGTNDRTLFTVNQNFVQFRNGSNAPAANLGKTGSDTGVLELFGAAGSLNVLLSHPGSSPDHGLIQLYDANEAAQAGMYVDSSGQGIVFGDSKQFRVPNPDDASTDIVYASLEGPEAAAYLRGTAELTNGTAAIETPQHFRHVASNVGLTVNLTPLSAESLGLAVVEKSPERFVVRELHGGSGTYEFDYMITAVRKGHEDFQVIQPARRGRSETARSSAARASHVSQRVETP